MALLDYESQTCPGCRGYLPETTEKGAVYVADLPHRCHRCDAVLAKQEEYQDTTRPAALVGWPAERKR